jgi:hypothetical protein
MCYPTAIMFHHGKSERIPTYCSDGEAASLHAVKLKAMLIIRLLHCGLAPYGWAALGGTCALRCAYSSLACVIDAPDAPPVHTRHVSFWGLVRPDDCSRGAPKHSHRLLRSTSARRDLIGAPVSKGIETVLAAHSGGYVRALVVTRRSHDPRCGQASRLSRPGSIVGKASVLDTALNAA